MLYFSYKSVCLSFNFDGKDGYDLSDVNITIMYYGDIIYIYIYIYICVCVCVCDPEVTFFVLI